MLGQSTYQISFDDKPYQGLNQWMLFASAYLNKYRANKWITFNRCRKEGGNIIKGSKAIQLCYWSFKYFADKKCTSCQGRAKTESECPCGNTIPLPKAFNVFNIEQTSLFDEKLHVPVQQEIEDVDVNVGMAHQLASDWNNVVPVRYGFDNLSSPYYSPTRDYINVPYGDSVAWVNEECLFKVFFHEGMHSTGHKTRLNRFDKAVMEGTDAGKLHNKGQYSAEELVAEMGSQILADFCDFKQEHIEDTSAYIASWIKCLEDNPSWVMWASSRASKGAQMIIDNSLKGGSK